MMSQDRARRIPTDAADAYLSDVVAARVAPERLAIAAGVMREIAGSDLTPLWAQVSIDSTGQPHRRTLDEENAWAAWTAARRHVDAAIGWTVFLDNAAVGHPRPSG